jgi:CheY-specific phosphatase CheX
LNDSHVGVQLDQYYQLQTVGGIMVSRSAGEVAYLMTITIDDGFIRDNTTSFAKTVCDVFKDMVNVDFTIEHRNNALNPLVYEDGLTGISHFSGMIQGDFLLSTDETTASKIAGVHNPDSTGIAIAKNREIYSSMICEVLNVSANHSLEGMIRKFNRLTLLPPAWVFGEYHMADYIFGVGMIRSRHGTIQCCLALNMASQIGTK